eukprot:1103275-Rhodomonas_salina.5
MEGGKGNGGSETAGADSLRASDHTREPLFSHEVFFFFFVKPCPLLRFSDVDTGHVEVGCVGRGAECGVGSYACCPG